MTMEADPNAQDPYRTPVDVDEAESLPRKLGLGAKLVFGVCAALAGAVAFCMTCFVAGFALATVGEGFGNSSAALTWVAIVLIAFCTVVGVRAAFSTYRNLVKATRARELEQQ